MTDAGSEAFPDADVCSETDAAVVGLGVGDDADSPDVQAVMSARQHPSAAVVTVRPT